MQFSSKEDIEAPIADVFAAVTDFDGFERSAIRRGIEVQRTESKRKPVGNVWDTVFMLRGKPRKLRLILNRHDAPNAIHIDGESSGVNSTLDVELLALSPRRTRMSVVLNLAPQTLAARLFVQSLKLAKGSLTQRFKLKIADFAKDIEKRQNKRA